MRHAGAGVAVWTWAGLVTAGLSLAVAGCATPEKKSDCAPLPADCPKKVVTLVAPVTPAMMETASSDFVNQAGAQAAIRQRTWDPKPSYYEVPAVQHGPLYFEDNLETVSSTDGRCGYGATWKDWAAIPYSDARWMLNTIALPVSMVVYPPWQPTCSDGEPNRGLAGLKYDAQPCKQHVPTPFDLKCPERQTDALTALTGGPLPVTAPAPAPATTDAPAPQPVP